MINKVLYIYPHNIFLFQKNFTTNLIEFIRFILFYFNYFCFQKSSIALYLISLYETGDLPHNRIEILQQEPNDKISTINKVKFISTTQLHLYIYLINPKSFAL